MPSASERLGAGAPGDRFRGGDRGDGGGGRGGDGGNGGLEETPPLDNARLALLLCLIASAMLFAALIGSFLVLSKAEKEWPPPGSPPLPELLKLSTAVLIASSVTLVLAHVGVRRGRAREGRRWLAVTAALGTAFLVLQGLCWLELGDAGLLPASNNFGGKFYLISWTHAAHALAGVFFLWLVTIRASRAASPRRLGAWLDLLAMYWHFVDVVWIALYLLLRS